MLPLADTCAAVAARCPGFADAAALLRVWAQQQQLSLGADGLSGCLLTLLLAHLVETGKVVSDYAAPSAHQAHQVHFYSCCCFCCSSSARWLPPHLHFILVWERWRVRLEGRGLG